MSFTGRIGTDLSYPGNIVLGIVDSFELASIGAKVHVIGVQEIRVVFDRSVSDTALNPNAYILSSVAPVLSFVPSIQNVRFEDANERSVILFTSDRMLYNAIYSLQISGVYDKFDRSITGTAINFTNNVQDPPVAITSVLSIRGAVDIIFDRPVGTYSSSASAVIRDPDSPGSDQPMVLVPWTSSLPENVIRFIYPGSTPTANTFEIAFSGINDISGNSVSSSIGLSLSLSVSGPYNSSSLSQIQIIDAYVLDITFPISLATIRVYFNGPVDRSDALNESNWTINEIGPHLNEDPNGFIISPDATDLATSITLINEIKGRFNTHLTKETIHKLNDPSLYISDANCVDLNSAISLLTKIMNSFSSHIHKSPLVHSYDDVSISPIPSIPSDVSTLVFASTEMKRLFDLHLLMSRPISFSTSISSNIGSISSYADTTFSFPVEDEFSWFVDLHVEAKNPYSTYEVQATVQSEDNGSITNPLNETGKINSKPYIRDSYLLSVQSNPNNTIRIRYDSPISNLTGKSFSENGNNSVLRVLKPVPTLRDTFRTFNWLVFIYDWHIGFYGALHIVPESVATIGTSDFAYLLDEDHLILKVNEFAAKFAYHISNSNSHYSIPNKFTFIQCDDMTSCYSLVESMISFLKDHNDSGDNVNDLYEPSTLPRFPGVHLKPGPSINISSGLDIANVIANSILDGQIHYLDLTSYRVMRDPFVGNNFESPFSISDSFIAHSYRPSLSSAFPKNALSIYEDGTEAGGLRLNKDIVEVWFSKPMLDQSLSTSEINITGGTILVEDINWYNERVAYVQVRSMQEINYSLSVSGLFDNSGNPIY